MSMKLFFSCNSKDRHSVALLSQYKENVSTSLTTMCFFSQRLSSITPKWLQTFSQWTLHRLFHQRFVVLSQRLQSLMFIWGLIQCYLNLTAGATRSYTCTSCWRAPCMQSSLTRCLASVGRWTPLWSAYLCLISCWPSRPSSSTSASRQTQVHFSLTTSCLNVRWWCQQWQCVISLLSICQAQWQRRKLPVSCTSIRTIGGCFTRESYVRLASLSNQPARNTVVSAF